MLTGGESTEQPVFFLYKKLCVKDVKINEVLKTKEEKYVGQSHPASKSLNLTIIIKKFYLDLNYTQFSEINFVKYLASQTLQKWVSDLQKSYI